MLKTIDESTHFLVFSCIVCNDCFVIEIINQQYKIIINNNNRKHHTFEITRKIRTVLPTYGLGLPN